MMRWEGVMPAVTTPFREDLSVDHDFLERHAAWLVEHGSSGIVALGSLGEGATLELDEKIAVLKTCVRATQVIAPVIAAVSALSTAAAVRMAREAESCGCQGLMILPPYVYVSDWREMKAHLVAVLRATKLSCMLYNNPIAYRTDFLPEHIAELAREEENLHAVKESSGDVRRITAIRALTDLAVFVGLDDVIVEGIEAGAVGWIAGLANALPDESVALFDRARRGEKDEALYRWFLPLLRLDTLPKFVQLIKLVQAEVGMGSPRVRPPRLELENDTELHMIREVLAHRPKL